MKKQSITSASLTSAASNSARKGLQQYFTPEGWAQALGAGLPQHRRTIADLHCGDGSLLRGLANDTTREVLGNDLDPTATLGGKAAWEKTLPGRIAPLRTLAHGDVLDLFPLLLDTDTRFDLLALNPPFSLNWPTNLLPEPLRKGAGKTIDSTLATLRMMPHLLTERGEGILIANQSTLEILYKKSPDDFRPAWAWTSTPSFFPGVDKSLRIGVLYLSGNHDVGPLNLKSRHHLSPTTPHDLALFMDGLRQDLFGRLCIEQPWHAETATGKSFLACCDEMTRRRDPSASAANVSLGTDGRIRTYVSAWQEQASTVPQHLREFLRSINRKHPLELTLQRGARMALQEAVNCGIWTVEPAAADAITTALADYDRDRAPLTPISDLQRIGWIDDAEALLCTTDLDHFRAGESYPLSTQTIEWKKEEDRPRYHAGKRDKERVMVRGTDLRLTLHHPNANPIHFIFNPEKGGGLHTTYPLEILATHFALPEVRDIAMLNPEAYQANLELLQELEAMTA